MEEVFLGSILMNSQKRRLENGYPISTLILKYHFNVTAPLMNKSFMLGQNCHFYG